MRLDVPVDPDAPEAGDWLIDELSKPIYQSAKPTPFDLFTKAIWDWIMSLRFGEISGPPALGLAVLSIVVIAGLVVAFLIFGMPRLNRRSRVAGTLFGVDDARDAAAMRRAAVDAASRADYVTAVEEMFRSIARGLAERTILTTSPGTTARDFSLQAAEVFPSYAEQLAVAAASFDDVRYLGGAGTASQFDQISALERAIRTARPALEPAFG